MRASSETPLTGYSTVTSSLTSWSASRSPVQMSTCMPCGARLDGQGGQDVVGLELRLAQRRDVHGLQDPLDHRHLPLERRGRRVPVALVRLVRPRCGTWSGRRRRRRRRASAPRRAAGSRSSRRTRTPRWWARRPTSRTCPPGARRTPGRPSSDRRSGEVGQAFRGWPAEPLAVRRSRVPTYLPCPTHDPSPVHQYAGTLIERMGIEVLEASAQRVVGTMPVAGNTQPYGLLHGGASAVLAETLGLDRGDGARRRGPGRGRDRAQRDAPPLRPRGPRHGDRDGAAPRRAPGDLPGGGRGRGRPAGSAPRG